ncbi:MAG: Undecaprenyl-phosphate galactose phosphotransferase [Acidobacteria bacterium]|jgi:exopolysaccharide biosynthesis polyprenyl glycosylphosphotransferase|nr:Undecaprenyl-phosphate galactose phosphotransferase [Acidobacteriota bacterium]
MLKQKASLIARIVYLADLGLTSVAFFTAFFIRDLILPRIRPDIFPTGLFPLQDYLKIYPVVLVIWSVLLFTYHSYHSHRTVPLTREAFTTLRVVVVGNVLLATIAYLLPLRQLSRSWFILFVVLSAVILLLEKILLRILARYVRLKGLNYRTVLIVGTGRRAIEIARVIEGHKYWGYKILGFVSDGHRLSNGWARYRVYGNVPDLRNLLERGQTPEPIDEIVFAVTRKKLDEMKQIFLMCEELGIRTRVAMNFFPNKVARIEIEDLEGIPFLTFTTTPSNETQLAAKRLLDIAVSLLMLTLSLPAFVVAVIAIRLTSPGSVLFKQERIGLNGRIFMLYKFRTMIEDAHARRGEVSHLNEMSGPVFKAKDDPRVTAVGRFLRKFSLDELPQLWNVLKGDMSLVGPRPPIPEEVGAYQRWHRRRLSMKPGLTCLWQISGRNNVDFDRWMQLDLQYIDNWSPSLDLKILLRTIPAVLLGRGAS